MQLCIKDTTGKTILSLEVECSDIVEHVKAKFYEREGTPSIQQRLIFAGTPLEDSHTLAECGMQGDTCSVCLERMLEPTMDGAHVRAPPHADVPQVQCVRSMVHDDMLSPDMRSLVNEGTLTVGQAMKMMGLDDVVAHFQTMAVGGDEDRRGPAGVMPCGRSSSLIKICMGKGKTITLEVKGSDTMENVKVRRLSYPCAPCAAQCHADCEQLRRMHRPAHNCAAHADLRATVP